MLSQLIVTWKPFHWPNHTYLGAAVIVGALMPNVPVVSYLTYEL